VDVVTGDARAEGDGMESLPADGIVRMSSCSEVRAASGLLLRDEPEGEAAVGDEEDACCW
jgi:hypothetical protein